MEQKQKGHILLFRVWKFKLVKTKNLSTCLQSETARRSTSMEGSPPIMLGKTFFLVK